MFSKIAYFIKKYQDEFIISIATTIFSILVGAIISINLNLIDPYLIALTIFGTIILFLLIAILFSLKRIIESKFTQINHIINEHFGFTMQENEFFRRLKHFVVEKNMLADIFVKKSLPQLIDKIFVKDEKVSNINIIFDSGTTITPIFPLLMRHGIAKNGHYFNLNLYTNNLAGIDEIHKIEYPGDCKLKDRDFNLIGGQPLNTYRATTGDSTILFLTQLWEEFNKSNSITISVVTANWILGGNDLNELSLCARGKGHLEFKKEIVKHSNYVFVIAPLTKILRIKNIKDLNDMVPYSDKYESFALSEDNKDNTYLLTTLRPSESLSPLVHHSIELEQTLIRNTNKNFVFCEDNPLYKIEGQKLEIRRIELPHHYIIDNFQKMYGYKIP